MAPNPFRPCRARVVSRVAAVAQGKASAIEGVRERERERETVREGVSVRGARLAPKSQLSRVRGAAWPDIGRPAVVSRACRWTGSTRALS